MQPLSDDVVLVREMIREQGRPARTRYRMQQGDTHIPPVSWTHEDAWLRARQFARACGVALWYQDDRDGAVLVATYRGMRLS
jgi:hypothetical protein